MDSSAIQAALIINYVGIHNMVHGKKALNVVSLEHFYKTSLTVLTVCHVEGVSDGTLDQAI
jgi:hypothetical protein